MIYTFSHKYTAIIEHEVSYDLPDGMSEEEALKYLMEHGKEPIRTENVDEDFVEDVSWNLL